MEHGFIYDQAIKAALLAKQSITGTRNILQGEVGGFLKVLYSLGEPKPNPELVVVGLGETFEGTQSSLKPYPSCKFTHASISAAIDLVSGNSIEPSDIEEVYCRMAVPTYGEVCHPKDVKWNPQTAVHCQFSLPYTVATGIITGNVGLVDFSEEAIWRSEIRALMGKIGAEPDKENCEERKRVSKMGFY